jgi:aerobic C4-dicarboxylate transport protein
MTKRFYRSPVLHIVCAIAAGILLGHFHPELAVRMKPLADAFIFLVKLAVGPIVFFTVTSGIAAANNMRALGRIGIKAIIYFELMSALTLAIGLLAGHLLQPGVGFDLAAATSDATLNGRIPSGPASPDGPFWEILMQTLTEAVRNSPILQILLLAILCGSALALLGARGRRAADFCSHAASRLLSIVGIVLKAAPLAAFGAIAFAVGKLGIASVEALLELVAALYLSMALFIVLVLGATAHFSGFSLIRFLGHIKEELLLVFGVGSSVAAMPRLIEKLEQWGCPKAVTGVVIPAGYSFNLNGTSIYITLTMMFLTQAFGITLNPAQQITIIAVAMVTSKGASGVAGSAFIALAATLAAVPAIPEGSLVLVLGIERLLKCRSLTNIIGNGVACLAISGRNPAFGGSKFQAPPSGTQA